MLAREAGRPGLVRRLIPARLPGWRRVVLRGTPYPTLLRDDSVMTEGALLRPDAAMLARLAAYEGPSYRLLPLRVRTARGLRCARAWVAPRWRADPATAWSRPG